MTGRREPPNPVVAAALLVVAAIVAVLGLRALGIGQNRPPVVLIGDSITANVAETARDRLGDDWALTIDGKPGFTAAQQVTAAENAARFPFEQAVVNLGTNDAMSSEQDLTETLAALGRIVDAFDRVDCVHLVTVSESMVNATEDADTRAAEINDGIRAIAASRPNVTVIDWARIVRDAERASGASITTDTVHPDEVGNDLLASAYDEALASCVP